MGLTDTSSLTLPLPDPTDLYMNTGLTESTLCGASCTLFAAHFSGSSGIESDGYFESGTANFTWQYTVDFDLVAGTTEQWSLAVDTTVLGALTQVSDGAGTAAASLSAIAGVYSGPGTPSGSLNLAGLGSISGGASNDSGVNAGDQTSSFTVTGTGSGTLSFTFAMAGSVTSACGNFFACLFGSLGDEGAVRFGLVGTPPGPGAFTADAYPGPGSRVLANDGHWATFAVTTLPEPSTALLFASGLAAMTVGRRRRSR